MSRPGWPRAARFVAKLRHAFALEGPHGPLTDADRELLARLAGFVARRQMASPATLFLESLRPLNYVGSQALAFLHPFVGPLFGERDYERLTAVLERREGIAALIEAIEAAAEPREDAR